MAKTKTDRIREVLSKNMNALPVETANKLQKEGYDVTPGYVSTIKNRMKNDMQKGKTTEQPRKGAPKRQKREVSHISIEGLMAAKTLLDAFKGNYQEVIGLLESVEKMGGVKRAKAVIGAVQAINS